MSEKVRKCGEAAVKGSFPQQSLVSRMMALRVEESTCWFLCMLVWMALAWAKASKEKAQPGIHKSLRFQHMDITMSISTFEVKQGWPQEPPGKSRLLSFSARLAELGQNSGHSRTGPKRKPLQSLADCSKLCGEYSLKGHKIIQQYTCVLKMREQREKG